MSNAYKHKSNGAFLFIAPNIKKCCASKVGTYCRKLID